MCKLLNTEPDPEQLPVEREDLALETQEVFHLYDKLQARWEGMSGQYLGKDLTLLPVLFEEFDIDRATRLYCWDIIPIIDMFIAEDVADKIKAATKKGAKSGSGYQNQSGIGT